MWCEKTSHQEVGKMPSVSVDEYLEALWILQVEEMKVVRIKDISEQLNIAPPSVAQMFGKMKNLSLIKYDKRSGAELTQKGKRRARQIVRNHRLIEKLLVDVVGVDPSMIEHTACGAEHYMSEEVANAICTYLGHPRQCPHGDPIPKGKCCPWVKPGY